MSLKRAATCAVCLFAAASLAIATPFTSYTPVITGGLITDFEGFAKGAPIGMQVPGVTFSQSDGALPVINVFPFGFGYGPSSGNGVLTGSTAKGSAASAAGIIATFSTPQSGVQLFFSDTVPLASYPIVATLTGGGTQTLTLAQNKILPTGYSGGNFPAPGANPLPGIFAGFIDSGADIVSIQVGPGAGTNDAFAIDDLRTMADSPEPASVALLAAGLGALALLRRRTVRR